MNWTKFYLQSTWTCARITWTLDPIFRVELLRNPTVWFPFIEVFQIFFDSGLFTKNTHCCHTHVDRKKSTGVAVYRECRIYVARSDHLMNYRQYFHSTVDGTKWVLTTRTRFPVPACSALVLLPSTKEEVNAFACVRLSVCLFDSKITQKRVHVFGWNVACRQMSG